MDQIVKTSMNLTKSSLSTLRKLATESNISMAEVVRRALETERFLKERTAQGDKILIERKRDGALSELLIR